MAIFHVHICVYAIKLVRDSVYHKLIIRQAGHNNHYIIY